MSHTKWIFEGELFVVGEDLSTPKPDTVAYKDGNELVYFKKNVYTLLYFKHALELRVAILDIYNPGTPYWTKAENVFWVTKSLLKDS